MRKFTRKCGGSARNSARVLWKTEENKHVFVTLSICVAHARHGSHVRYSATYTIYVACVVSISEAAVARATFRGVVAKKNLEDVVAQQRRRARAQIKALSLALIYSYYTYILLSARACCVPFTPRPPRASSAEFGRWTRPLRIYPKKATVHLFKISNRIRIEPQALS